MTVLTRGLSLVIGANLMLKLSAITTACKTSSCLKSSRFLFFEDMFMLHSNFYSMSSVEYFLTAAGKY